MGSLAMLMLRPTPFVGTETVNDADGHLANFWRAVEHAPDEVARWADQPVNENDLHARHVWLREQRDTLTRRLEGDPDYFDPKVAGWWCWGQCCWIGSGWCDEGRQGPWGIIEDEEGFRQLVHLGSAGRDDGEESTANGSLAEYFAVIANRLRRVRVCCGDWSRICGPTPTVKRGLTAVFLDPPYSDTAKRDAGHGRARLYSKDSLSVAHAVRKWAIEHGDDPKLRIALCGYADEHVMPSAWSEWAWKAKGGYGSQSKAHDNPNARRERIWFSPHCVAVEPTESMPLLAASHS